MEKLKKLFGGLNMSWRNVIIFAVIVAAYTALINQVPFFKDTSFCDIAISYEWWILFAIIIITNSKSALESMFKVFVFFVISQPLIYLIEVPFLGWGVFRYYQNWIIPTLATLPMGFVGWYIKKNNVLSVIILSAMTVFLSMHAVSFFKTAIFNFPNHILSGVFCVVQICILILCIFDKKRERIIGFAIAVAGAAVFAVMSILNGFNFYAIIMLPENISVSELQSAEMTDGRVGTAYIDNNEVMVHFTFPGKSELVLTDESGKRYTFEVSVDKDYVVTVNEIK
ncbi:MAG: hypothetical protein ACI4JZ_04870 [Oscillospiraceae bacterium]